jgi:hypothetical protein
VRVAIDTQLVEVAPGAVATVAVEVANNGNVIDGVTARVLGIDEQYVTAHPPLLPLFPDARGQLTLSLAVPNSYPAGRHPLAIEVESRGARARSEFLDLTLDVAPRPRLTMGARPKLVRTRRSARFVLELCNDGNVPLEVNLQAVDMDRSCETRFSQDTVRIEAGATVAVVLAVRCPRMFTGGELDRNVTVVASATRLDLQPDEIETEPDGDVRSPVTMLQVRQRPVVSRGLLTALILAGIVALWAGAFLLGLAKVFGNDPMTKDAPASFFVTAKGGSQFAANSVPSSDGSPAGALPKDGQVPAGVGAEITGTVVARSDHQPVGSILVQAIRLKRGKPVVVSSAATQSDGTYTLAGLFPMSYYVRFSAPPGYPPVWYPAVTSVAGLHKVPGGARAVLTSAQGTTNDVNVIVSGIPATIRGTVTGGDGVAVPTKVIAHPLVGNGPPIRAMTDAGGGYTLRNVSAPGTYQLTFTAKGYLATVLTESVSAGDSLHEPAVRLGANTGRITGIVTDGSAPLGGATVATTVNGKPLSVITPTSGLVGAFELDNVPTPGTYVIMFSAPGHGTETQIIDLRPGEQRAGVRATLNAGTGSVTGRVFDASTGSALGGATITVGGAMTLSGQAPATTTLTAGNVGRFAINNLAAPGSYTLTATLDGYAPATVPFTLDTNGKPAQVTIRLGRQVGAITGAVTGTNCRPGNCVGATVSATNGAQVWTTTVSANGGPRGRPGYRIAGLLPGTYSVTVIGFGHQQTAMVVIRAGRVLTQDLTLGG